MKKLSIVLISVLCLFALAACGGGIYDDTVLKDRIKQLEQDYSKLEQDYSDLQSVVDSLLQSNSTDAKIYDLGETFTYVSAGISLFSIKVETHPTVTNAVRVTITNLNMPGYAPNDFVKGRYPSGNGFATMTFSTAILSINEESVEGGTVSASSTYLYLGFPMANNAIIPYAIYKIR